jgi:hypothetical protein
VSLSADGLTLAIGADHHSYRAGRDRRQESGHVRVLRCANPDDATPAWTKLGADIYGEQSGDQTGFSVSLSADGTTVAFGERVAWATTALGRVRVCRWEHTSASTWDPIGDFTGTQSGGRDGCSISLSADGSVLAIGAQNVRTTGQYDESGLSAGRVQVFQFIRGNRDLWRRVGDAIDGEAQSDRSGCSVSLSADGTVVAVGAFNNSGAGLYAGHVRVFKQCAPGWVQIGGDIDGEARGDKSGLSVGLSADGTRVVIGAYGNDGADALLHADRGHARVVSTGAYPMLVR